jgi:ribosomal protein L30/L7E
VKEEDGEGGTITSCTPPIRRIVKALRLRWAGHVARMDDTEILKRY